MAMKRYSTFLQSSRTGASSSDSLISYPEHLLGEYYPSAEMQSVQSAAPVNWAVHILRLFEWELIKLFDYEML